MGVREMLFGAKSTPVAFPDNLPVAPASWETVNPNTLVNITSNGLEVLIDLSPLRGASPAEMYRTQPYLRAVVSFLGRNIAQLGVGTYLRDSDTTRQRDETSVTAQLLREPNQYTTRYELFNSLVCDIALWDKAFWMITPDTTRESGWRITSIPSAWVQNPDGGNAFEPEYWWITPPGQRTQKVPASSMIHFHGWNPSSLVEGTSPVTTLRDILLEQIAAVMFRAQRWERGARVGTVITRPKDAPRWSPEAENRFRAEWRDAYTGNGGSDAGGTPILQDGMTINRVGFSAVEDEFVEASKLALTQVASVFHVNPTMLGLLDNANYSNVREFRRMLYGDTLGPWLAMIEDRLNTFLLPLIGAPAEQYIEFNIAEKLQGSFEEQAQVASMAVGGPYMTRNEYRARQNLPPVEGGDELIVPMNVVTGGQPSPNTPVLSAPPMRLAGPSTGLLQVVGQTFASQPAKTPPRRTARVRGKYRASQRQVDATEQVLRRFYRRQGSAVMSSLGSKSADEWWDEERWDEELTDDLLAVSKRISKDLGNQLMSKLGVAQPYDLDSTVEFLRAVMQSRAESINATTRSQIEDALASVDDEDAETPADVFDEAENVRSVTGAATITTTVAGIAMNEGGKQAAAAEGGTASKTWVVTSENSRHPEMDGETVGINEDFSNGAAWPGDAVLGPDETSGCSCELVISIS